MAPTRTRAAFHELPVAAVERLTDDAVAVTFAVPPELQGEYDFVPGQALTLRRTVGGVEERRTYSICARAGSAPRIAVRAIPDGLFSRWLVDEVRAGDVVDVQTPTGSFRADPALGGRHLLVAAGSGITPMLSIAASLLENPAAEVTLLYGNRTTTSVMFADELADLKDAHGPRFTLAHVLSREPRDVELFSGRLEGERLERLVRLLAPVERLDHAWLCGPLAMTQGAREVLTQMGMPAESVHAELFFVDEPPPTLRHADVAATGVTSEVTVVLDGKSTTATVARDVPLLDSAQRTRADLPFACKGGVCGTCRAHLNDGEVDMVRNYALEETEVADGFVLTCQSYPVSDRVVVDFDC